MSDYYPDWFYEELGASEPYEICPEYEEFVNSVADLMADAYDMLNDPVDSAEVKVEKMKVFLDNWSRDML